MNKICSGGIGLIIMQKNCKYIWYNVKLKYTRQKNDVNVDYLKSNKSNGMTIKKKLTA